MKNLISKTLKQYQVLQKIRETGTRILYQAYDADAQKYVGLDIVKFTDINAQDLLKVLNEQIQKNKLLNHTNIAPLINYGISEGILFFVYDFYPVSMLSRLFNQINTWNQTGRQLVPVSLTLAYVHSQNNCHGYFTPSSIVLDDKGTPFVFDFGMEWIITNYLSKYYPGEWINSWEYAYCSPEQLAGMKPDSRSDIYSMGLIIYEWLTGEIASFARTPLETLNNRSNSSNKDLKLDNIRIQDVKRILVKNLASDPDDRYQSLDNMNILLAQGALGVRTIRIERQSIAETLFNKIQRQPVYRFLLFLTPLFMASVLVFWTLNIKKHQVFPLTPDESASPQYSQTGQAPPMAFEGNLPPVTSEPAFAEITPLLQPASFPVFQGTTLPVTESVISTENSANIIQYALWGIGGINGFSNSPGGEYVAVATSIGVFLYNAENLALKDHINTQSWVSAVEFSPDSKYIVTGDRDGLIVLWEIESGKEVGIFSGHEAGIIALDFSSDGKYLVSVGLDNTLRKWDVNAVSPPTVRTINDVSSVLYSPDDEYIVTGGNDFKILLWNTQTVDLERTITLSSKIVSISNIGNSAQIAVGGNDRKVTIIDLDTGELLMSLGGMQYLLSDVKASPNGKIITAGNIYGGIHAWDNSGLPLWSSPNTNRSELPPSTLSIMHSLMFSPDGQNILSGVRDGAFRIIHATTGEDVAEYPQIGIRATRFAISHNGLFAVFQSTDNRLEVWSVPEGSLSYYAVGEIKQGEVFSENDQFFSVALDDSVVVYEVESGKEVFTFRGLKNVQSIAFVRNDTQLAAGNAQTTRLWSLSSGQETKTTKNYQDSCTIIENLDGDTILRVTKDHYFLTSQAFRPALCSFTRTNWMKAFLVNENTQQIVAGGNNKLEILVTNIASSLNRIEMLGTNLVQIDHVAINPSGNLVAATRGDFSIGLWDVSSQVEVIRLFGHNDRITDLHFSPDGKFLFSTSADGTIRVWGVP